MSHMPRSFDYDLARVLLVDADPASRLTLKTVLETSGYNVDAAASAAEAVGKLEDSEYELVLSDLHLESPQAGLQVLAHAVGIHSHAVDQPNGFRQQVVGKNG